MSNFTDHQIEALRALFTLWPNERMTVVGASALACYMEMKWRRTHDLDVAVLLAVEDASEDLANVSGWQRHPSKEHEWLTPDDVKVDIIPVAPKHLARGRIKWPKTDVEMSLVGFRLAFDHSEPTSIAPDVMVHVAPVPVITVLKMAAYLDRPSERQRDLEDLAYILEEYLQHDADDRYSKDIFELGLTYEETSSYVLGKKVGALINQTEKDLVLAFLAKLQDEGEPLSTQARMASLGPPGWHRDPDQLLQRIAAFKLGVDNQSR